MGAFAIQDDEAMQALRRAIAVAGDQTQLADAMGESPITGGAITQSLVSTWLARGRIPAEYCPLIEAATGVRCEELAPRVAWRVLRASKRGARKSTRRKR